MHSRHAFRVEVAILLFCCITLFSVIASYGAPAPRFSGVPRAALCSIDMGAAPSGQKIPLGIVLAHHNQAVLDDLLKGLYDPNDVRYGHYLTPAQFQADFDPTQADVDAVSAFSAAHGLHVDSVGPGNTVVHVSGSISSINHAFGVTLHNFQGSNGLTFHATTAEPSIPTELSGRIIGVIGLSNAARPHIYSHLARTGTIGGNAPGKHPVHTLGGNPNPILPYYSGHYGLSPNDVRSIYGISGSSFQGNGQILGLYEASTFYSSDISTYDQYYNLNQDQVVPVGVDGYNTSSSVNEPTSGIVEEVVLDIEMMSLMSPHAKQIRVYEVNPNTEITTDPNFALGLEDAFLQMASEPDATRPTVISVSYGDSELNFAPSDIEAFEQDFQQLAAQGQEVCIAAGDAGAYTDQSFWGVEQPNTDALGSQPWVTGVGGTSLVDTPGITYSYESSWGDPYDLGRGYYGTGGAGGISQYWPEPSWQVGSFNPAVNTQGSQIMRNVPDVSLFGDYDTGGYDVYITDPEIGGSWAGYNGTSASSPLWAAFLADVNSARTIEGLNPPTLGFANPALYSVGDDPGSYASDYNDIADGSNNLYYKAVKGYDNSTGWGSFVGGSLMRDLAPAKSPTIMSFSPIGGQVGTEVTINGSDLSDVTGVAIGGVAATINSKSATTIVATVPSGATTGAISLSTSGNSDAFNGAAFIVYNGSCTISGTVYNDANGNDEWDTGEKAVGVGWTVYADSSTLEANGTYAPGDPTAVTGTDGTFTITGLAPGTYVVGFLPPTGWSPSWGPADVVNLDPGEQMTGITLGATQTATEWGFAEDYYGNPLTGFSVFLNVNGTGKPGGTNPTATVDQYGEYVLVGIKPGTYTLDMSVPSGYYCVYPQSAKWTVDLTSGDVDYEEFIAQLGASIVPGPYSPNIGVSGQNGEADVIVIGVDDSSIGFDLYRSTNPTGAGATLVASDVPYLSGYGTFLDPTVTTGVTYYYMAAGENMSGIGPMTAPDPVTIVPPVPPIPGGLTGAQTNGVASLSWTSDPAATSYDLYVATSSGGELSGTVYKNIIATTYQAGGLLPGTTYYFSVAGVNAGGVGALSKEFSITTPTGTATAQVSFVKSDSQTVGNWKGAYGGDGWNVIGDPAANHQSYPSYAIVTPSSNSVATWTTSSLAPYCLQSAAVGSANRVAGAWYAAGSFTVDVNITGSQSHQVALYLLDWASGGRGETITISDATSNSILNSQTAQSFAGGVYEVWDIKGHVKIKVSTGAGPNCVLSGLFFGPGATSAGPKMPTGLFAVGQYKQIALSWNASTGATSYNIYRGTAHGAEGATPYKSGVTTTNFTDTGVSGTTQYFYQVMALNSVSASGAGNEASASALGAAVVSFVKKDTTTQGSWKGVYGLDGYNVITDNSGFNPDYPNYAAVNPSGAGTVSWVTQSTAANCLQSSEFASTNRLAGGWYSATGFSINVNFVDGASHTIAFYMLDWVSNSGQASRAETITITDAASGAVLNTQTVSNFAAGVYYVWNIQGNVNINFKRTAGPSCVVSGLFFGLSSGATAPPIPTGLTATGGSGKITLAWTVNPNAQQAFDYYVYRSTQSGGEGTNPYGYASNGSFVDTNVSDGVTYYYQVMAVSEAGGSGVSAQVSATPVSPAVSYVEEDTATQGGWKGVYGSDGWNVISATDNNPSYPGYAVVTPTDNSTTAWTKSSTAAYCLLDPTPGSTNRLAGAWYNTDGFSIDLDLTDGNSHPVELYLLDWAAVGRSETIVISDVTNGNTLSAKSVAGFAGGVYEDWKIKGHVKISIYSTGGPNAVVSGLFFN